MSVIQKYIAVALAASVLAGPALAAEKPKEIAIGISTFLSGPASVFGVPAQKVAEMMVDEINQAGGIDGVKVRAVVFDEGAGSNQFLSEYRRIALDENAQVMISANSSAFCLALPPLADDLEVPTLMWDCGTPRATEDHKSEYAFRPQGQSGPEMLAAAMYLLKTHPDFKTVVAVNQDYAAGRDNWDMFKKALVQLKPDVQIVAELFPKFGAPDYSTEISRIQAIRPDVVVSTAWGGDLDTFIQQSAARGLPLQSTFVLPLGESSLERLGDALPAGVIVGARGDHYFRHPKFRTDPQFKQFVEKFREKTGSYPIYSVFHMAQAIDAIEAAYAKAIAANNGVWPEKKQLAQAFSGLTFKSPTSDVTIRADHQGVEDQLIGTTIRTPDYPFAVMDKMAIVPGSLVMPPEGMKAAEFIKTVKPDIINDASIQTFGYEK
ncbi:MULTISPECIES: ABC transporter substrate-binding protein [Agrobacterium]|uniref:ABC transporter substrate-binding protein n=1 Tax=Agrobacterium rubi TaxID=28099 RepID=A0AAE7UTE6_9HYPH|nr:MULTISPECIES: ABC transporter substrate-binding protein [Agrobacterium]MBN7807861.1 ABC transporter substrate-binding protein [Agrobacterium rosae]NTE89821.1 ABC transporter substrate-binding protein [Agrobacterium rubi]NTF05329.1 ABC transporter substrate-binding protein [Agrobacterium rubi]NTF39773.1 ABC transporter substrate-binding protein [Agrobacterium rubi]OCJ44991.1 branched-chain amino acid ABC transporter substrate-binding protein [Agrobacterium rubi]